MLLIVHSVRANLLILVSTLIVLDVDIESNQKLSDTTLQRDHHEKLAKNKTFGSKRKSIGEINPGGHNPGMYLCGTHL